MHTTRVSPLQLLALRVFMKLALCTEALSTRTINTGLGLEAPVKENHNATAYSVLKTNMCFLLSVQKFRKSPHWSWSGVHI